MKDLKSLVGITLSVALLSACGGGGGGGGHHDPGTSTPVVIDPGPGSGGGTSGGTSGGIDSSDLIRYPYETVYGDVCSGSAPSPGCTFVRETGKRVTVSKDPDYDKYGYGSDDLWFVKFDSAGQAKVYNDIGEFQYNANARDFAGYISGNVIGVGTTGFFWENISNGTYWLGKNGVLYNANSSSDKFGEAINNKNSGKATDTNLVAQKTAQNQRLITLGTQKLMKKYGFSNQKATAVATALNTWAIMGAERGKVTTKDMDRTFKTVFGVQFGSAVAAVKDLSMGDTDSMKDLTNRSAAALGLKPHQAQDFIKDMYRKALGQYGYDVDQINW